MKHALAYLTTARAVAAACLVAATYAMAMAQSASAPQIFPDAITLVGTVSVRELSASAANLQTPQMQQSPEPIEIPLPGGVQTSPPSKEMLEKLPLTTEPNAGVGRHFPFRQINGFTGITLGSEAAVGGNGTPPTQGLAVHDNIVAEIVNSSLQFSLVAPQVLFDPNSKRWYFLDNISPPGAPPGAFTGGIRLAVSQIADPLGTYFIYHVRVNSDDLPGCGGRDCWPGYPHGGYDANAFFISTRLSTCFPNCLVAQAVYVLPKARLEAGLGGARALPGSSSTATLSCNPAFRLRMSLSNPLVVAPNT